MGGYSHLEAVLTRHNIRKQLGIGKSAFVIITVGEVNNNKNQGVIIEAMASLGYPDVYYIVCGEGEQMETLKKKTIELQLEERVFFLGYRPDVHKYLKASDVFAFPSRREGLGIAAIEAMNSSLPLLTSDVHGINDYLIEGETGYKYRPCDVNGFACGIKRFRDDNYQAVRIGNRCRKLAKKYDISIVDSIMRKVYSFDF